MMEGGPKGISSKKPPVEPGPDLKLRDKVGSAPELDLDLHKKETDSTSTETSIHSEEHRADGKRKFKAVVVDTTDVMKEQARDAGDAFMTMEPPKNPDDLKGFKKIFKGEFWNRTGQKIWKHGLWRDYYRNRQIDRARKNILETGNIFAEEKKDKAAHDKFAADIIEQFSSEYDEVIHEDAGEIRKQNEKISKEDEIKKNLKKLIVEYAAGRIGKDAFLEEEKRIFQGMKEDTDERKLQKKEDTMYVSNFIKIAEEVKEAMRLGEFLESEDFEIDLTYGKSKAGVRTEAKFTKAEALAEKISHTAVGQFVNETTLSAAFAIASTVGTKLAQGTTTSAARIVPLAGSAIAGSLFAKLREAKKIEEERRQHAREMARGGKFDPASRERREEMEKSRYQTQSARKIIDSISASRAALTAHEATLAPEVLRSALSGLSVIEARIRLSDQKNIDLIDYSDTSKVVEERRNLDIERARMKVQMRKLFEAGKFTDPEGRSFEDYLDSLTTTQENLLVSEKDTGIDAKDRIFKKMKSEKSNKAAWKAFKTGLVLGTVAQETVALFTDRVGIAEDIYHNLRGESAITGAGMHDLTAITQVKHYLWGDFPRVSGNLHEAFTGSHIKLPDGVTMVPNTDGSYNLLSGGNIIAERLTVDPDGTFTPGAENILRNHGINIDNHFIGGTSTQNVTPEEYLKNHSGQTHPIHRSWWDNDSPMYKDPETGKLRGADFNELRTQWGGEGGKGIDTSGNYVLDVSHMTKDGSFHDGLSADAKQLLSEGKLKVLISLSKGTQNQVFEFTIPPDGKILFDPNSEIGKIAFANVGGEAKFMGGFAEIGQDMDNNNFKMLSTLTGPGVETIADTVSDKVPEVNLDIPGSYNYELPPFVPLIPRSPLEPLDKKEEKGPATPGPAKKERGLFPVIDRKLLAGREMKLLGEKKKLEELVVEAAEELPIKDGKFEVIDADGKPLLTGREMKRLTEGRKKESKKKPPKKSEERKKLEAKKRRGELETRIKDLEKKLAEAERRLAIKDGEVVEEEKSPKKDGVKLLETGKIKERKLLDEKRDLEGLIKRAKAELILIDIKGEKSDYERRQKLIALIRELKKLLREVEDQILEIKDGEIIEDEVPQVYGPRIKGLIGGETAPGLPEHVDVRIFIDGNIKDDERRALEVAFPGQNVAEIVEAEVVKELNDKNPDPEAAAKKKGIEAVLGVIRKRLRGLTLALVVVSNFAVGTSFRPMPSAESIAYDNVKIESLKDLENITIDQEAINKLDNLEIINKANEGSNNVYLVVDKSTGFAHLYKGGNLVTTYEVGTGAQKGDDQTVTVVRDGKEYWNEGNRQTGAGIYTVNKKWTYEGAPSFTMINERGIEVPTAFHRTPSARAKFFNDNNRGNNRMSNGCLNFMASSLEDLAKREGFGPGTKVYVLPDDPHNRFTMADGELRFVSNDADVNRTIKPYEAKPIVLRAENPNEYAKTFLQTLGDPDVKSKMMRLYPTVSNSVYNELAKVSYGIFGKESSFGTYGGLRGQSGRLADYAGVTLGRGISAGVTQIRISSINPKVRQGFDIKKTTDLYDIRKAAVATLGLLLEIYTENIPAAQKGGYRELVPLAYNNPGKFRKTIKTGAEVKSSYVNRVLAYADSVKTYSLVF